MVINYFVLTWVTHYGKAYSLLMIKRPDGWHGYRRVWHSALARRFRKGGMHTLEPEAVAFHDGGHPVTLFDDKKTRPLYVEITEILHDPKGKTKSLNPDSEEFDEFAGKEGLKQMIKANALQHPEYMMLIIVAVAAFFGGVIFGPYLNFTPAKTVNP